MTDIMQGATGETRKAANDLLHWYQEAGVDIALDETPHDRLAEGRREHEAAARKKPAIQPASDGNAQAQREPRRPVETPALRNQITPAHSIAPDEAAAAARRLAGEAHSLAELKEAMLSFDGCALKQTATQLVFGDGSERSRLMVVGEAPGREEDLQGIPFVGRAGQLLNRMLAAIDLKRSDVYIANVIAWRPPGNRTPTAAETAMCKPFIERQIELIGPDVLLCLGNPSTQTLLNQKSGILSVRGIWFDYACQSRKIAAMASLHPAYLLRQPSQKRLAWTDLLAVREQLGSSPVVRN